MLQSYGIKAILVFDGAKLQMKAKTEQERKKQRVESQQRAQLLMQEGNIKEANKKFIEGIEIDDSMIH